MNKKSILNIVGAIMFIMGAIIITRGLDRNTQKLLERVDVEKLEKGLASEKMKIDYNACINSAAVNYAWAWNHTCKEKELKDNCPLEKNNSDVLNAALTQDKKNCLLIYEIGMNAIFGK